MLIAAIAGLFYYFLWAFVDRSSDKYQRLEQGFDAFQKAFLKSNSVSDTAKTPILQDETSKLSNRHDTLTKHLHDLEEKPITRESLDAFRKNHLEMEATEEHQEQLNHQQKEIAQKVARKSYQQQNDALEKRIAAPFIPIVDYTITTLYDRLSEIAREFALPLSSDFAGAHPSIYRSAILDDDRLVKGEHVISVGNDKRWEFHIVMAGNPLGGMPRKALGFQIKVGNTSMGIEPRYLHFGNWNLSDADLYIFCRTAGDKPWYSKTCSFSEYQSHINAALRSLVYNQYGDFPLKSNTTPPSPTPDTALSPN